MAAVATELIEAKHKRDQVGRKLTSAALLAAYRRSGLTQRIPWIGPSIAMTKWKV